LLKLIGGVNCNARGSNKGKLTFLKGRRRKSLSVMTHLIDAVSLRTQLEILLAALGYEVGCQVGNSAVAARQSRMLGVCLLLQYLVQ